jgi:hypothetical protein
MNTFTDNLLKLKKRQISRSYIFGFVNRIRYTVTFRWLDNKRDTVGVFFKDELRFFNAF